MLRPAWVLALLVLLLLVAADDDPPKTRVAPYPPMRFERARPAQAFVDSVGVNVHMSYVDTSYRRVGTIRTRLRELGVRHVRDGLCPTCRYQVDALRALGRRGIKADLIIGDLDGGEAKLGEGLRVIRRRLRGAVDAIEGPNEPDSAEPDWREPTRRYQAELYSGVNRRPALASLPVIGPSLVEPESRKSVGDLSARLDRGNLHPYPSGDPPLRTLSEEERLAFEVSGDKPTVITEVGYHSALASNDPHAPASERAIAHYTPRLVLEAFRQGVLRTYLYQLADQWSDAEARKRGFPEMENRFGLLRWDLSPKPAFQALRRLLRAAGPTSKAPASPGGLRFSLWDAGTDVRRLLLRTGEKSYALVLWRDVRVWDRHARRDLTPLPDELSVVLGQPVSQARRFDPVSSDSERSRWADPREIPLMLGGAPVVLLLTVP